MEFDGTLIVVSHDRDFLKGLTTRTFEFRDKKLHEYLGDVNFFLEKRKLENMRAVEMKSKVEAVPTTTVSDNATRELSYDERKAQKKLERAVQNAERKIEDIESKIKKMELEMGVEGFYQSEGANAALDKYNQLKKDLEAAMEAWENATMELDDF